jgi:hypothetical protein
MSPRSSESRSSPSPGRPRGEERVFSAPDGKLWGASVRQGPDAGDAVVLVFTCMTEARQSVRAVTIDAAVRLRDLTDDALRAWLATAPTVGKLN